MAWIYLAASGVSASHLVNTSDQLPIVKMIDTAMLCFCRGCSLMSFGVLPSGTILQLYDRPCCPEMKASISSMGDSPARTFLLLEMESAWKVSAQDYFSKSSDYVAIYDQDSFSWKTSQLSLFEGLNEFVWSSLRSGMIVDGRLYRPPQLEPHTDAIDGSCLPTPLASRCGYQSQGNGTKRLMLPELWKAGKLPTPMARDWKSEGLQSGLRRDSPSVATYWKATTGTNILPSFVEWIMGYPVGHTALKPSVMQWFLSRPKQHSKDCVG